MKKLLLIGLILGTASFSMAQSLDWALNVGSGSGGDDHANAVTTDAAGNIYVTGAFESTVDFDPDTGTHNITANGSADVFILKLNRDGGLVWVKTFGGKSFESGNSIKVDGAGNVYVFSHFQDTVDVDPGAGTDQRISEGGYDILLQKYNSSGDLSWSKQIGAQYQDFANDLSLDPSGNIYVTGEFSGTVDFDPGSGTHDLVGGGAYDIFVAKYNNSGALIWAYGMGDFGSDRGYDILYEPVDKSLYISGSFQLTVDFNPDSAMTTSFTSAGSEDAYLLKMNTSGDFQWVKRLGGTGLDVAGGLAADDSGNVFVTGRYQNTVDLNPNSGVTQNVTSAGGNDIFIQKFRASGDLVWAHSVGGVGDDYGNDVSIDAEGNAYIAGNFADTVDFDPGSGITKKYAIGNQDIYVEKFDRDGNFEFIGTMGAWSNDNGFAIDVDITGDVITAGRFISNVDFDPDTGVTTLSSNGGYDVFVQKLGQCIMKASVSGSATTLTANVGSATYQWMDCSDNSVISGATSQSFDPTASGDYAVIVSVDGCSDTSGCFSFVLDNTGIKDVASLDVKMYPNPVSHRLFVESEENLDGMEIYEITGKHVMHSGSNSVDVSALNSGVYFVKIISVSGSSVMKRFVKQ